MRHKHKNNPSAITELKLKPSQTLLGHALQCSIFSEKYMIQKTGTTAEWPSGSFSPGSRWRCRRLLRRRLRCVRWSASPPASSVPSVPSLWTDPPESDTDSTPVCLYGLIMFYQWWWTVGDDSDPLCCNCYPIHSVCGNQYIISYLFCLFVCYFTRVE